VAGFAAKALLSNPIIWQLPFITIGAKLNSVDASSIREAARMGGQSGRL
jgi:hypothetical protein